MGRNFFWFVVCAASIYKSYESFCSVFIGVCSSTSNHSPQFPGILINKKKDYVLLLILSLRYWFWRFIEIGYYRIGSMWFFSLIDIFIKCAIALSPFGTLTRDTCLSKSAFSARALKLEKSKIQHAEKGRSHLPAKPGGFCFPADRRIEINLI